MTDPLHHRLLLLWLFAMVAAQALFAAFPEIDLVIARAMTDGSGSFVATRGVLPWLSGLVRLMTEIVAAVIVFGTLAGWIGGRLRGAALRLAGYAAANVLLAPGVVVNLVLKAHVGRARPATLSEFGGTRDFTPAWQFSEQCDRNCSFVSGEVSIAATLALIAVVLFWPRMTRAGRGLAIAGGLAAVLGVAAMRLALGRHFLSDAVFATLISAGVALALYPLFGLSRARRDLPLPQPLPQPDTAAAGARQTISG
ncbi:MAG: phosphatase PAP2 family protein [Rhodobacteraceae bacterium]|jgi:lipid A 4'-phosphatase|nr:phosphatase PAP2 family protein [Paracoccaceae bacterium]